ncbi:MULTISPECIES: MurR/RpiR family transcriptional regulator [unclassified Pseudoalteromonas]|uniref:MurR/RpiR family transcriptional regulator n=1 Tax=unclassified Pseudoalteromonas TaxID=194690 RepID=UPI00101FF98A|nr:MULTISPECIES: MurR/RpiR family transcriptional regulator [unclassified Pseudoalteromonas]MCG9709445.1 MurR/RpiR family transcriptional regulator [Pseudoalteromonas sp. Isolate3]RZD20298.1 MurR/RpiR family transcriptional regulator [Pseudoalteromonas sp. MEBiC 03485]
MDIVSRIKERLGHLRQSEQAVAQLILADLQFAASASISDLADKANVSHASITRLAKALGCSNVRDMKLQLAQSLAVGERFINESSTQREDIPAIYKAIHDILDINAGLIKQADVEQAALYIANSRHSLIFGVGGGSSVVAQECHNRLFRLDILSNAYSDPVMMRMTAASVDVSDVVVMLSLTGCARDLIDTARIAKEYGAKVIAICPQSELADLASIHLPIKTNESDYIFTPSTARYAMLAAVDVLASEVAILTQKKSREKLRRIKHELDQYRQGPDRAPIGD